MKEVLCLLLLFVTACSAVTEKPQRPSRIDLPTEAFELLNQSASDPCSICSKQMREKAFKVLNARFRPGMIVESSSHCQFMRSDLCGENELVLTCYPTAVPLLTFKFHTAENHLVGISSTDFTERRFTNQYHTGPTGTVFEGVLRIVEYEYGDGPGYNYYPLRNHLQIHCRILDIKPVNTK